MSSSGENQQPPLVLQGIGVTPGIAIGPAVLFRARDLTIPRRQIPAGEEDAEWRRLTAARDVTRVQLTELRDKLAGENVGDEVGIIDSHLMVLDDEVLIEDLHDEIYDRHHNAEWGVRDVANAYIEKLGSFNDALLSERADDISDVSRRLLRNLLGVRDELPDACSAPCIIVANRLTPSEASSLPRDVVRGVALDRGSQTSHAALVLRACGIPAVFGLGDASTRVANGQTVAVDGARGVLVVQPGPAELAELRSLATTRSEILATYDALRDEPAITPDGHRVTLFANISGVADTANVLSSGAEGIGLFRTEYLWLAEGRPIAEAEQQAAYAQVYRELAGRPVVVRAFDLGGDKFLSAIDSHHGESNPFLGLRSIRFLLRNEDVFRAQIRAILRAAAETGSVPAVMLPMVTQLPELLRSREILDECAGEVAREGCSFAAPPRLGAMIEVPSAALQAQLLARHCDFFSVGSNDLAQYTMAADRGNELVSYLYQPAHPAVLRLIHMSAQAARAIGINISLCGDMAARPILALLLLGMRLNALSMPASAIPLIKSLVRRVPLAEAEQLVAKALQSATADEVLAMSRDLIARRAPEILKLY